MPRGSFRVNTLALPVTGAAPPSGVTSMTFVANRSFTASLITLPPGTQAGDIAILFDHSSSTTNTVPSGWVSITGISTTGIRQNISRRIVQSGDQPDVTTWTGMGGTTRKVLLVYRPNVAITTVTATVTGSAATTNSQNPGLFTLAGEPGPMIAFACYSSSSNVATRGWTVGTPSEYSTVSTSSCYVKALITNSGTPATTQVSMTSGFNNALQAFRLKFA